MTLAPPRIRGFVDAAASRPRTLAAAVAVCLLLAVGAIVTLGTGTSATGSHAGAASRTGVVGSASSTPAVRWWSNAGARAGSTIDAGAPLAVAHRLHTSRRDYCGMLRQTLRARGSFLTGVAASDPALLTTTRAFVGELRAVATPAVAGPWRVLGNAMIALVSLGGRPAGVQGIDAAAVGSAERAIARDARSGCGVDLAKTA